MDQVTYQISINNKQISSRVSIHEIAIGKVVNRISTASLVFLERRTSSGQFALSNSSTYLPGNSIEIKIGYNGDNIDVYKGIISKQKIKFKDGTKYTEIECLDSAFKLNRVKQTNYFNNIQDSDLFTTIISNYGLELNIEDTDFTHEQLVQYNSTDWDFLCMRASTNKMVVINNCEKVSILKPNNEQHPKLSLEFGSEILEFEAEMNGTESLASLTASSWSPENQDVIAVDGERETLEMQGNITSATLARKMKQEPITLYHAGDKNQTENSNWATSIIQNSILSKIKGKVLINGVADILPGDVVELSGLSNRFNGNAFVSEVHHQIDSHTWSTTLSIGLNSEKLIANNNAQPPSLIEPFGTISGLFPATVSENEDPQNEHRIGLCIPSNGNNEETIWARTATLDAGANRGSFFRPEIDDEVIVGFLNDDPRDPIILGMLYSNRRKPHEVFQHSDSKGFVSREGMQFIFNEEETSVLIQTPSGKKLKLSDSDSLIIEDDIGNKLKFDQTGILMESGNDIIIKAGGDVTIEGVDVNIGAIAEFKAEGGAGSEVTSSAITKINGSLVQIN